MNPETPNQALQRTPGFGVQLPGAALVRPAQSRAVLPAMKPGTARHSPRLRLAPPCSHPRPRPGVAELGVVRRLSTAFLVNILPPVIGRILVGIALLASGIVFITFGYVAVSEGYGIGIGFILVGAIPLVMAPIYVWRGGRLGAEIRRDCLIVHSYFHDIVVPLERPLGVARAVDATAIETPNRRFVLNDCFFSDLSLRDALFEALSARADYHIC